MNQPTHSIESYSHNPDKTVPHGAVPTWVKTTRIFAGLTLTFLIVALDSAAQTCVSPPSGLVSWWRAEGNGSDSIGTNTGTLLNGLTFMNGEVGQAFNLDGVDDHLLVANDPSLNFGANQDFSIEAWIQPQVSATSFDVMTIVDKRNAPDTEHGIGYEIAVIGGRLECRISDSIADGGSSFGAAGPDLRDGQFHHVAVTIDRNSTTGGHYYVDGVAVLTFNPTVEPGNLSNEQLLRIGKHATPGVFGFFKGKLDEVSIYRRALSATEAQAIYGAGRFGKCGSATPPTIITGPASQSVLAGADATFSVTAGGTTPLSYQWLFNGTNLSGATGNVLVRANVKLGDAGNYAVVVSNSVGTATSSNAVLTVNAASLSTLWNVDFAAFGRVKVGFAAAGQANTDFWNDYTFPFVAYAGLSNLKRADGGSTTVGLTLQNGEGQTLVSHPDLMYQVACYAQAGVITLTVTNLPTGEYEIYLYGHAGASTANTVFQLVVGGANFGNKPTATDSSWSLTNWVEGAQYVVYRGVTVTNGGAPVIVRCQPGISGYAYLNGLQIVGMGPSTPPGTNVPPAIVSQPQSQTVQAGADAAFEVTASGTAPLSYQWSRNGTNLSGATGRVLALHQVSASAAGNYLVVVSNSVGSVTSITARLTVLLPPATVQVLGANAMAGGPIEVPVILVANGNENALSLSLNFNTQRLTFAGITLGSGAPGAALLFNTTQAGNGNVGIAVALEPGLTFAAGAQEVVRVAFTSPILGGNQASDTPVTITNQPVNKLLADAHALPLPANYLNGVVRLAPTRFEGDASPYPDGDQALDIFDWVQVGRYVAALDTISNANAFQRVDCAPRSTLGDGRLTVTDWVQAGRYAAGLDPATFVGGPAVPVLQRPETARPTGRGGEALRHVSIANGEAVSGLTVTLPVVLQSLGNEIGLGFSLNFDPSALHYVGVVKGSAAVSATFHANAAQASFGKVGLVLALPTGSSFVAGTQEIVRVTFTAQASVAGKYPVVLGDHPVWRAVSDSAALELATVYVNNEVVVHGSPTLAISPSGTNVILSWPSWAGDFTLQAADATPGSAMNWNNTALVAKTNGATVSVTSPASALTMFFRLFHP